MLYSRIIVGEFAFRLAQLRNLGRELASSDPKMGLLVEDSPAAL